eukprot:CAMPEP_0113849894 /NCGR_PEP_ID=MMETSP0372-20130328/3462_1 /TAXON_ID=340204 /ORGANISM="Lankesteria abbotti" /LENGTH=131 /DNA_ID=CAMNT_0000819891 /DNA_START=68 /DNA_END=460 /DNA_ORIENTATION=- /assembly_acc=CAM_ASM_000359
MKEHQIFRCKTPFLPVVFSKVGITQHSLSTVAIDQLVTGATLGYCAGCALRKAIYTGAAVCGLGFATFQYLKYAGHIDGFDDELKDLNDRLPSCQALANTIDTNVMRAKLQHALETGGMWGLAGFGGGFLW